MDKDVIHGVIGKDLRYNSDFISADKTETQRV